MSQTTPHGPIEGIHHVSCITGNAQANLTFYTQVLGMRLVAKSVNQDDPGVYHLFYGEEEGRAGADLTFFEYPGAVRGTSGPGMVHRIVFRIADEAALAFWRDRLAANRVALVEDGTESVRFTDPEGLELELRIDGAEGPDLVAAHPDVPAAHALRGFYGIHASSREPERTADVLTHLLGATDHGDGLFELRGELRSGYVQLEEPASLSTRPGAGTVHHVAFGMRDADLTAWLQAIDDRGMRNSGEVDRTYFRSIYTREPGGVLYELATEGPGFTVDGPVETLGTRVILPPWLEPQREAIEANLTPLPDPRAGWPAGAAPVPS